MYEPGEWRLSQISDTNYVNEYKDDQYVGIVAKVIPAVWSAESYAAALERQQGVTALVLAVPQMLAALEEVATYLRIVGRGELVNDREYIDGVVNAAIAAAKGQP